MKIYEHFFISNLFLPDEPFLKFESLLNDDQCFLNMDNFLSLTIFYLVIHFLNFKSLLYLKHFSRIESFNLVNYFSNLNHFYIMDNFLKVEIFNT
jgi:hypothetical protein